MTQLEELRKQIDSIDEQLLDILIKRLNIAQSIAEYKNENNLPIHDEEREQQKLKTLKDQAKLRLLDENQIETIFKAIIKITRENEH